MGIRSVLADVSTMSSVKGLVPIPKKLMAQPLGLVIMITNIMKSFI